jgi:hypothetical protein
MISRRGSNDTREAVAGSRTLRQHDTVPVALPLAGRNLYVEAKSTSSYRRPGVAAPHRLPSSTRRVMLWTLFLPPRRR